MKVGILTFHFVDNYGAMLQVYALQKTLSKQNIESDVIDYRPSYLQNKYNVTPLDIIKHPRKVLYSVIHYNYKKRQHSKFVGFMDKYLKLSPKTMKVINKNIENQYKYFITGSDQVWNPNITGEDKSYFLNFIDDDSKKISYAASIGNDINENIEKIVLKNTEKFDKVSVREEEVSKYFKLLGKNFNTVLDPTLLLSKNEWIEIESKPINVPKRYILVYDLECRKDILDMAVKKSKEENIELITIHPLNKKYHKHRNLVDVGPEEFIYLFHNAEYIYTNSFHGLVFSTIFDKKVFVISHSTRNSRLRNLINLLELKHLESLNYNECNTKLYVNSKATGEIIRLKVDESIEFLKKSMDINR